MAEIGEAAAAGRAIAVGRAAARRETKAMRVDENCIVAVVSWRKIGRVGWIRLSS